MITVRKTKKSTLASGSFNFEINIDREQRFSIWVSNRQVLDKKDNLIRVIDIRLGNYTVPEFDIKSVIAHSSYVATLAKFLKAFERNLGKDASKLSCKAIDDAAKKAALTEARNKNIKDFEALKSILQ